MRDPKDSRYRASLPTQHAASYDHVMLYEAPLLAHAPTAVGEALVATPRVPAPLVRPPPIAWPAPPPAYTAAVATPPGCPSCSHCQVLREGAGEPRRRFPRGSRAELPAPKVVPSPVVIVALALAVVAGYFAVVEPQLASYALAAIGSAVG